MRILRISGQNLASLEQFELNFEAEPLRSAGTFAITGHTGAGKSTLLDAMCVALYDRTPRLCDDGGVPIIDLTKQDGEAVKVRANDVRTLLRRGAGQGHAEIEFIGADHQTYRSRWAVQRARGKATGQLQEQKLTLQRLDANRQPVEGIGRTKTETLAEIVKLVGLTFEQFRRAVLLAQGDFAAFLRAKPQERAELLERMTATELYAEVSRQAHLEAAWWRQALAKVSAQGAGIQVLEPQALEALVNEQASLESERGAAVGQAQVARAAAAWHGQRQALEQAAAQAARGLEAALAAQAAQAGLAAELEQAVVAAAHGPALTEALRLRREVGLAAGRLQERADQRDRAQAALAAAQEARATGEARLAAAVAAAEAAAPLLRKARELDTQLAEARRGRERRLAELTAATAQASAAAAEAAALGDKLAAAEARRDERQRWLDDHGDIQALAAAADGWAPALAEAQRLCGADAEIASAVRSGTAAVQQGEAGLTQAQQVAAEAAKRATAAEAAAAERENALAHAGDADLAAQLAGATAERDRCLRQGDRAAAQAMAQADRRADLERRREREAEAAAALESARQARSREEGQRGRAQEAEAALLRMQAALDLRDHRGQLVEGEPCPLCGATAHPWGTGAAPDPLLDEQRKRVEELRAELSALGQTATRGEALAQAAARAIADLDARLARNAAEIAERQAQWQAEAGEGWPAQADDPQALQDAQARLQLAEQRRTQLQAQLEARDRLAAEARRLRSEATAASAESATAQDKALQSERVLNERREAAGLASQRAEQHAQRWREVEEAVVALGELRPAWLGRLHSEPARLAQAVSEAKAQWLGGIAQRDEALQEVARLQPLLAAAAARAGELRQTQEMGQQHLGHADAAIAVLQNDRQYVLGGQGADAVEAALRQAELEERAAQEHRQAAAQDAVAQAAAAEAAWSDAESALVRLTVQRSQAEQHLGASLEALGIAESELARRLERDANWQREARTRLEDLSAKAAAARGAVQQAELALENHLRAPPELGAEEASAALAGAEQRCQALDGRAGEIRTLLRDDEGRRRQRAAVDAQLARLQAQAKPWLDLGEAIGSADGSRFRQFAQGLTLDVLVRHANAHLGGLSRRYRLQRVPGADLELQVIDADMADEVRGLATLSGGETFLVSLALALALASLSSRAAAIESLFIDEGFGTLDKETLSTAVAALNRLQQAGRKVGVISHVDGLAESLDAEVQVIARGQGRSEVRVLRA